MNELVMQPEGPSHIEVLRAPAEILAEAQVAAKALKEVISKKEKPVKFNGEQYLEFEDWQTIGKFYGLACSTSKPSEVMVDGVVGAEAQADVCDIKTGRVIGHASAWCLRDEPNWKSKPLYQLGSMAQTRAGAKALRNLLSWVVVLAGYKTTPAEEIQGEIVHEGSVLRAQPAAARVVHDSGVLAGLTPAGQVADIIEKLVAIHAGNQDEVEAHLKFITRYKSKEGPERWLTVGDLESVAQRKPEWIGRIHKLVTTAHDKARNR